MCACVRTIEERGKLVVDMNENYMNIMNGWREKTNGVRTQRKAARPHNVPVALRQLMHTQRRGR